MKTKEEILEWHSGHYSKGIINAMQEHTDQAIEEYKRKLKEVYAEEFDFPHTSRAFKKMIELIDA